MARRAKQQTKQVPLHMRDHFRQMFAAWVDATFENNASAAGRALGMTQSHVSALCNGARGPGLTLLLLLREKTGKSLEEWLGIGGASKDGPVEGTEQREAVMEALAEIRAEISALRDARDEPEPPPPAPKLLPPARKKGQA